MQKLSSSSNSFSALDTFVIKYKEMKKTFFQLQEAYMDLYQQFTIATTDCVSAESNVEGIFFI